MSEIAKYEFYKKKLQGVCDENNLVFRFRHDRYPIALTIRPVSGVAQQMTILENAEENGYISPDAAIVFAYKDGALTYKMSETFTIGDALFSKIKNLYKNMHSSWLQFFFKDVIEKIEHGALTAQNLPSIEDDANGDGMDDDFTYDMVPLESFEDDEDDGREDSFAGDFAPEPSTDDPLVQEAIRIVRELGQATITLLQRRLNIGYAKASDLMDMLEFLGIVGEYSGSKPRKVLPYENLESSDGSYEYERGETEEENNDEE